jgi:hypothetical protein
MWRSVGAAALERRARHAGAGIVGRREAGDNGAGRKAAALRCRAVEEGRFDGAYRHPASCFGTRSEVCAA